MTANDERFPTRSIVKGRKKVIALNRYAVGARGRLSMLMSRSWSVGANLLNDD